MSTSRLSRACFFLFGLTLSGCAQDPTGALISQLADSKVEVRRAAASALEGKPNAEERTIVALAKGAADGDAEVRYRSIAALGELGAAAKASLPSLKIALQDPEKQVRLRAALSICKIDPRDHSFEAVLISGMREGDGKTLLEVGEMGANAGFAVPILTALLGHASPQVRVLAANDLAQIGPAAASATAALKAAKQDSNPRVKRAAEAALEQIEAKGAGAKH
jgi:HEAT repeat protein